MDKNNKSSQKESNSPSTKSTPQKSGSTGFTTRQEFLDATPEQKRIIVKKAIIKGLKSATTKKLPEPTHKSTHEEALKEIEEMNKGLERTIKEGIESRSSSEEEK